MQLKTLYNGGSPQGNPYPQGTMVHLPLFGGALAAMAGRPCRSLEEEETCYQIR